MPSPADPAAPWPHLPTFAPAGLALPAELTTGAPAESYPAGSYDAQSTIQTAWLDPAVDPATFAARMAVNVRELVNGAERAVASVHAGGLERTTAVTADPSTMTAGIPTRWFNVSLHFVARTPWRTDDLNRAIARSFAQAVAAGGWQVAVAADRRHPAAPVDGGPLHARFRASGACTGASAYGEVYARACTRVLRVGEVEVPVTVVTPPAAPAPAPAPARLNLVLCTRRTLPLYRSAAANAATGHVVLEGGEVTLLNAPSPLPQAAAWYAARIGSTVTAYLHVGAGDFTGGCGDAERGAMSVCAARDLVLYPARVAEGGAAVPRGTALVIWPVGSGAAPRWVRARVGDRSGYLLAGEADARLCTTAPAPPTAATIPPPRPLPPAPALPGLGGLPLPLPGLGGLPTLPTLPQLPAIPQVPAVVIGQPPVSNWTKAAVVFSGLGVCAALGGLAIHYYNAQHGPTPAAR